MTSTHGDIDDVLKELDEALAVAPAEDFAARVRARVAAQPRPASGWHSSWWLAAAGIVLAVFAGRTLWRHLEQAPLTTPALVVVQAGQAADVARPPERATAATAASQAQHPTTQPARHIEAGSEVSSRPLEVLVPPDQRIALASLVRGLADNRLDAAALVPAEPEAAGVGPLFERITFTPIVFTIVTVPPNDDTEGRVRSVRSGD